MKAIGEADASLLSKAREIVLEAFRPALRNWLGRQEAGPMDESILRVEAIESELIEKDLNRTGDVSEWFEPGQGQNTSPSCLVAI